MAEWLVSCGNAPVRRSSGHANQRLDLHLDGQKRNVDLRLHDIRRRLAADIPAVLTDLLEIAAYVFAADEMVSRGGPAMASLGRDWRRRFRFVIPVRNPSLWSRPDLLVALIDSLAFMSEDDFGFEFVQHDAPASFARYLDLGPARGKQFASDEVLLFSGGMDSLCGALTELQQEPRKRLLLVSHQSSTKLATRQKALATALHERFPERVLHVPVRAGITDVTPREFTQRTRSFLFTAIAAAAGAGQQRILFYENGVVSFNLPIAGQIIGARASRTTHPRTLDLLARLLGLLLERDFKIENPFIWKTRTDIAVLGASSGHADLLGQSVSCSRVRSMERDRPHCGVCSQCIDRRVATLAAGLGDEDKPGGYRVDLLTGPRERPDERAMVESYVGHALEMYGMAPPGFVTRFANEIARWSRCFPGMAADTVAERSHELHRRHAAHVVKVLELGIQEHARELAERRLPESCLLRLVASTAALQLPHQSIMETAAEPGPSLEHRNVDRTLQVEMGLAGDRRLVVFPGAGQISSPKICRLLQQLIEPYRDDQAMLRSVDQCRFTQARSLAKALGVTEESLRRQISRFRRAVAILFEKECGLPLPAEGVIETRNWKGYRLNPRVRLVNIGSVEESGTSRFVDERVTTRISVSTKSRR